MTPLERQLRAAEGYLELGLPKEAREELGAVEPEDRAKWQVIALWTFVHQSLEQWQQMEAAALALCAARPEEAQWAISLAYATRRAHNLEAARTVLREARARFPEEGLIRYNLACYECQLGRLAEARAYLDEAFRMGKEFRPMAMRDPDLLPLHAELLQVST